ncbi:hypothetical protein MTO96_039564 [Rhipicephalus appendiculatus]
MKYASVMATDPGCQKAVQDMICFRFHRSIPHFYVQPALASSRFITALHQLLRGDPARMAEDYKLNYAWHLPVSLSPLVLSLRPVTAIRGGIPGITSMIPFQTDRREERRQPARERNYSWFILVI